MRGLALLVLVVAVLAVADGQAPARRGQMAMHAAQHLHRVYQIGERFHIECKDARGEWGPGPICADNGDAELEFAFGVDAVVSCGWSVADDERYAHMSALIQRERSWECRIRMLPDVDFFVPFFIPVWGAVEKDHIHVDNHMNFVFHAWQGKIMGVAAYPIRDQFEAAGRGGMLTVHGPVKWFKGGSFEPFASLGPRRDLLVVPPADQPPGFAILLLIVIWMLVAVLVTAIVFVLLYQRKLKPQLMKHVLELKKTQ